MIKSMKTAAFAAVASFTLVISLTASATKEIKYKAKASSYEKLTEAKKGGTLFASMGNNPKVINPVLSDDQNSSKLEPFLWATLFTEDSDTLYPLPYLAESYSVSADKKSYTFTLNKNAKWQDGTPVTSDDVKFTFDTLMNPKTDAAAIRSFMRGITLEVKDTHTFTFKVPEPQFDSLRILYLFAPIQKAQFEKEADFNKARGIMNPIGNGPYTLKTFSRDQRVEFERKKDWWGSSLPHFKNRFNAERVVLRIITDPNLEYERFVKGDLSLMEFGGNAIEIYAKKVLGTDKEKFGTAPGSGKKLWSQEFQNKAPRGYTYIGWNLRKPVFASKKTRQALAHLADTKEIAEKVYYGFAHQATSPFGSLTRNSDQGLRQPGKMIGYDPKKALALLKEDGWADSDGDNVIDKTINGQKVPFRFELRYNSNNPARGKIAQILKENFKKAGIDITIRAMEWNAYLADIDERKFDAIVMAWTATPYPNPRQIWHTDSEKNKGSNFIGYSNPKVDQMIDRANREFDPEKRAKILQEINRALYDDQPYTWLVEPRSLIAAFSDSVNSGVWAMTYDVLAPVDIYQYQ